MAQSFDAWTQMGLVVNTVNTTAVTVGAGSNIVLLAWTLVGNTSDILTSVTYNSVAMTKLVAVQEPTSSFWSYLHGLLAPATGTHDLVQTITSSNVLYGHAASYFGVSGMHLATSATNGGTATFSLPIDTDTNDWVVGLCRDRTNAGESAVVGTARSGVTTSGIWLDSNAQEPDGGFTLQASSLGMASDEWVGVGVALQAVGTKFILIPGR